MSIQPLIQAAIAILGSETKLGTACGVSQGAIWKAKRAGRVSGELAVAIEKATRGVVPRWRLRPDLWEAPEGYVEGEMPAGLPPRSRADVPAPISCPFPEGFPGGQAR
ncbi:transcriptional regulator [Methylobacterium nigriterrae]|uniref:transcriptional regulator n=1 Tax=Methylobacterium nigriterrae TaxID=3127512 RepID=UPI003D6723C4